MRFCMVTTYYPPYHFGGDAVFVQELARDLAARGHHAEVIHCEDAFRVGKGESPSPPVPACHTGEDGVTVHRLHSALGLLSPLITQQTGRPGLKHAEIRRILDRGFDVVNYHNISLVGGPGILALGNAAAKIYTLHEHWLLCPTHIFWKNGNEACVERTCFRCSIRSGIPPQLWRYTSLSRQALRHADVLLSPSAYTARQHAEAGLGRRIEVLNTYSSVEAPEESSPLPGRPRFLFAGRVTASKGVHWLVEQFSKLPQYDLDIAGQGDLLEPLKRRYLSCHWIRFLGVVRHDEIANRYAGATALILPSLAPEVFPLCVLEAFACGTPAIVSAAGGTPEAVEASGAGFVYRDEDGFHAAVSQLANQPGLRERMGTLARAAYRQRYTRERYITAYLKIAREIIASKEKRATMEAGS